MVDHWLGMVDLVVLVNTWGEPEPGRSTVLDSARRHLGLTAIGSVVEGLTTVAYFPDEESVGVDRDAATVGLEDGLRRAVGEARHIVFGLSTSSADYHKLLLVAGVIRNLFPEATLFGGGPHFVRENAGNALMLADGTRVRDPVEIALQERVLDFVVVGNAQPFVEFIRTGKTDSRGVYRLVDGEVVGSGVGGYMCLPRLPFVRRRNGHLNIALWDGCPNRCDYCAVSSFNTRTNAKEAASGLRALLEDERPEKLYLKDSNALSSIRKIEYYDSVFRGAEIAGHSFRKSVFLDAASLVDASLLPYIHDFIAAHGVQRFAFGRDTVTAYTANKIGRRLRGRVRTQEELDDEKRAVFSLIEYLEELSAGTRTVGFEVALSYVLSPFETKESALALVAELEEFFQKKLELQAADRVVPFNIEIRCGVLSPFPGTKVRRDYLDHIVDPENYELCSISANAWKDSLGRGVRLIDDFLCLCNADLSEPDFFSEFRSAIHMVYRGKGLPRRDDPGSRTVENRFFESV